MSGLPFKSMVLRLRKAAPYRLMELLLPGGTLLAVLLWLSRNSAVLHGWGVQHRQPAPRGIAERVIDRTRLLDPLAEWALPVHTA